MTYTRENKLSAKLLAAILAIMVAITMCPLFADNSFAAEGDPSLNVNGTEITFDKLKALEGATFEDETLSVPLASILGDAVADDDIVDFVASGDYKMNASYGDLKAGGCVISSFAGKGGKTALRADAKINGVGLKQKNITGIISGPKALKVDLKGKAYYYSINRLEAFAQTSCASGSYTGVALATLLTDGETTINENDVVTFKGAKEDGTPLSDSATVQEYNDMNCIVSIEESSGKKALNHRTNSTQHSTKNIYEIAVEEGSEPVEKTIEIAGDGVAAAKTYTVSEFLAAAAPYEKTADITTLNNYGTKQTISVTGITVADFLKLVGAKSTAKELYIETSDNYTNEVTNNTYTVADLMVPDMNGTLPMIIWKEKVGSDPEEALELPKLAIGQKDADDLNNPKWMKRISKITISGSPEAGEMLTDNGNIYTVVQPDQSVSLTQPANKKYVTIPATITVDGVTYAVTGIAPKAFKATKKVRTITVRTKTLTKAAVKGSLKSSKVRKIKVKVGSKKENKKYVKIYKKIFKKKNSGKWVRVSR